MHASQMFALYSALRTREPFSAAVLGEVNRKHGPYFFRPCRRELRAMALLNTNRPAVSHRER